MTNSLEEFEKKTNKEDELKKYFKVLSLIRKINENDEHQTYVVKDKTLDTAEFSAILEMEMQEIESEKEREKELL